MRRLALVASYLAFLVGCGSVKTVQVSFLQDASLVPSTRPIEGPYRIAGDLESVRVCEEGEPLTIQAMLADAMGDHDALVQVTIERRLEQTWAHTESFFGKTTMAPYLVTEIVCYDVAGYPVDLPKRERGQGPPPASEIAPAPSP